MRLIFDLTVNVLEDGSIDSGCDITEDGEYYAGFSETTPGVIGTMEETIDHIVSEMRNILRHNAELRSKLDHTACCGNKKGK